MRHIEEDLHLLARRCSVMSRYHCRAARVGLVLLMAPCHTQPEHHRCGKRQSSGGMLLVENPTPKLTAAFPSYSLAKTNCPRRR